MGVRLRSLALAASIVLATIGVPAATGGAVACADDGPRAGLVVDTGERVIQLCVSLDAAEVSGLRLIELAGAQHGLSYGFGLGGGAVCRLDGVGPEGDDCFADYPEYWGYWHGDGRGGWTWASTGAGSFMVGDGDMEGWVWGSGDSGASHRKPPALAIGDVCEPIAEPSPSATRSPTPSPKPSPRPTPTTPPVPAGSPTADRTGAATTTSAATVSPSPDERPSDDRTRTPSPSRSPSPSVTPASTSTSTSDAPILAVGAAPTDPGGPPGALFAAVALAALLGAGGWLRLRSRAKDPA